MSFSQIPFICKLTYTSVSYLQLYKLALTHFYQKHVLLRL